MTHCVTITAYGGGLPWILRDASAGQYRRKPLVRALLLLLRDEEAVGSNPATPTPCIPRSGALIAGLLFCFRCRFRGWSQQKVSKYSPDSLVSVLRGVGVPVQRCRGLLVSHDRGHVVDRHAS